MICKSSDLEECTVHKWQSRGYRNGFKRLIADGQDQRCSLAGRILHMSPPPQIAQADLNSTSVRSIAQYFPPSQRQEGPPEQVLGMEGWEHAEESMKGILLPDRECDDERLSLSGDQDGWPMDGVSVE